MEASTLTVCSMSVKLVDTCANESFGEHAAPRRRPLLAKTSDDYMCTLPYTMTWATTSYHQNYLSTSSMLYTSSRSV